MHNIYIYGPSREACDAVQQKLDRYFEEREESAVICTAANEDQLEKLLGKKVPDIALICIDEKNRPAERIDTPGIREDAECSTQSAKGDAHGSSNPGTADRTGSVQGMEKPDPVKTDPPFESPDQIQTGHFSESSDQLCAGPVMKFRNLAEIRAHAEKQLRLSPDPGIRAAQRIREKSRRTLLIFLAKGNGYAEETYLLGAIAYLRVPVSLIKIRAAMNKALWILDASASFVFTAQDGRRKVYAAEITYIESANRQVIMHTENGDILGYGTLRGILDELPEGDFLKISRYCAVAAKFISRFFRREVVLKNDTRLPVSQRMLKAALDAYETWNLRAAKIDARENLI